jgi:hypothetical protein
MGYAPKVAARWVADVLNKRIDEFANRSREGELIAEGCGFEMPCKQIFDFVV